MAAIAQPAVPAQFSRGYRSWFLFLLVSIYACSFLDRVIINTVAPAIIKDLRLSDLQFGLLGGAAFALFYVVFGMPIAWLAERFNRINIIAICVALWSAMTAFCGFSQTYVQLLAFRMGVGFGEGGCSPAAHSLISDHYPPKQRASALAIYSMGIAIGTMLGAVCGGFLAQAFNWRTAFIVVAIPGIVLALLARLTLREPARGHSEAGLAAAKAPAFTAVIARLFSTTTFRHLCAGVVLVNLAGNGVNVFTTTYLVRAFHMRLDQVGLMYGLAIGTAGIIGNSLGGFGSDLAGRTDLRWYVWAPAIGSLVATPIFLLAFSRTTAIETVGLFFCGSCLVTTYFAPSIAVTHNLVEPRMRATASAVLFLLINTFGQALGPAVMGWASDLMTRRAFTLGNYAGLCRGAHGAAPSVAAACNQASAGGLRIAIMATCVFFLWGSVHFLLASRTIRRDLQMAAPATQT